MKSIYGVSLIIVFLLTSYSATAGIVTKDGNWFVSGSSTMTLASFSGTATPVLINLGDGNGPQASGVFNFSLDPTKTSTALYDFDLRTLTFDLNLLVMFPLQQTLGVPAVELRVLETGDMPGFDLAPPRPTSAHV